MGNEELLDEFETWGRKPFDGSTSPEYKEYKELRAEIIKRMTPATPAPIAAQTEKEMDCDCPCDVCAIGTGKHCGKPPCDISKAEQVAAARLQDYWRCFHCDFVAIDPLEAHAHFGDVDDAEEFKPLCKWWASMTADDKVFHFQQALKDLEAERRDNLRLRTANEGLEWKADSIEPEIKSYKPFRGCRTIYDLFCLYDSMEGRAIAAEERLAEAASLKQETQPPKLGCPNCTQKIYTQEYIWRYKPRCICPASSSPLETPAAVPKNARKFYHDWIDGECTVCGETAETVTSPYCNHPAATPAPADTGAADWMDGRPHPDMIWGIQKTTESPSSPEFEPLASTGDTPQPQDALREIAIKILSNCAYRYCHPTSCTWGTPQQVIDKQIEIAVEFLATTLPAREAKEK